MSGIKAINDSVAAERRDLKTLSDQFSMLGARLTTVQGAATQILRGNAVLAERFRATEAETAEDNASVVEQLKALAQVVRDNASAVEQLKASQEQTAGIIAKVSEENLRSPVPLPPSRPVVVSKRRPLAPLHARTQPQS